jgi:catechol 2,3-dioxygenase-like lactoylglutathione lyase family enzyme
MAALNNGALVLAGHSQLAGEVCHSLACSMLKQLAHICIHSADLAANMRFYCDGLGLEKAFAFEREGKTFGYYLKLRAGTFIEVFEAEAKKPGNIDHVAIEVDDIDAVIQRVRDAGYPIGEKQLGADQTWQVWVTDPDGIRIEFQQYTAESYQHKGGVCRVNW